MSKEEMRDRFETRWGQTNDEQGLYFIPELNTYGCELAKNRGMADRKSSAWYYFQLGQESALVATPKADAQPVAGQSRFTSQKDWQPCSYEHHLMVIANPSEWPGYETRALFTRSDADEVERLRIDLELTRLARQSDQIEIDGLKALNDGLRAQLAERDALFADVLSIDVPRTAKALEQMRAILSASEESPAPATEECTSCDGSGEYIDAIGDWRGYCSCPAGVELKNRPAVGAIAEQKCETCHDQGEVFVSKGKVEYGMLTEPEPIYKPCPDCAEPANKEGGV